MRVGEKTYNLSCSRFKAIISIRVIDFTKGNKIFVGAVLFFEKSPHWTCGVFYVRKTVSLPFKIAAGYEKVLYFFRESALECAFQNPNILDCYGRDTVLELFCDKHA
jgi:hypothetical protein